MVNSLLRLKMYSTVAITGALLAACPLATCLSLNDFSLAQVGSELSQRLILTGVGDRAQMPGVGDVSMERVSPSSLFPQCHVRATATQTIT